ncbi:hypothetical protein CY34DRAFT_414041 [Suillus luteus UH-Slu-Lm8-n1]|uniref:Uncharacterized protein n=1 Tax=Suillus luteus UH-Slu-Lm8-n1 TaxID=930992 RepID=A0A0D0B2C3_9AGAM|nr:hypothetical protein CY34DRAFT_414041 [Suillus luteus UH-Slu-Lm8-n1]
MQLPCMFELITVKIIDSNGIPWSRCVAWSCNITVYQGLHFNGAWCVKLLCLNSSFKSLTPQSASGRTRRISCTELA